MSKDAIKVAVTGGAGQIAYSLLFRIGSGEMFGKDQPVDLHILEVPEALNALQGVVMELEDCAYPLLNKIVIGSDPKEVFKGVHYAILVGAKPRGLGMERKDLLLENAKIFIEQGRALNVAASKDVQVLVVGNPCNTNCWITMQCAPNIPRSHFHAMTRLDQNRAVSRIANKVGVGLLDVEGMLIWGNHSATQVPDCLNSNIGKQTVREKIADDQWITDEFLPSLQQRGAAIIAARGKSSAASAANAIIDSMKSIITKTPRGEWYSDCVVTDDNPYGIQPDLIFSFPCRSLGKGKWEIVAGLKWDSFLTEKIKITEKELLEEREIVRTLLS